MSTIPTLEQVVARQEARIGDHVADAEAQGHITSVDGRDVTCTCGYASTAAPGAQTLVRKMHAAEALALVTIPTV